MGQPGVKQSVSGVLACWFDDSPLCESDDITALMAAEAESEISTSSQPVVSDLVEIMDAITDAGASPEPACSEPPAASIRAVAENTEANRTSPFTYHGCTSVYDVINRICQSNESPFYQWLKRNCLESEFVERIQSLEQRWAPDGTFCAVRRTDNGFVHTIVLKDNNTKSTQRVTAPDGTVLLHITASGHLIEGAARHTTLLSA